MTCSAIQVTVRLGNVSTSKTHTITVNTSSTFQEFLTLVGATFHIRPYTLKLTYIDADHSQYQLNAQTYPRIHSRSSDRIQHLTIVGVHFEILEIVEDFCSAVVKLDELIQHLSFLATEEFNEGEEDELHELLIRYSSMVETGIYPWQTIFCDNNRTYFYSQSISYKFLSTAKQLRLYHLTRAGLSTRKINQITTLRYLTLHLMWNFLASKSDRLHWHEHGAVQLAVDTFFDSEHIPTPANFEGTSHPLLELSIGVLVQFAEMESVKVQLCNNARFMGRFCEVIADTRNLSSTDDDILYNGQLKLNTLMCMLSSPSTHLQFLRRDIIVTLTNLSTFVKNNVASYYFYCLCIAFLFGFSLDAVTSTTKALSNTAKRDLYEYSYLAATVRNFWREYRPHDQYVFEVEKQYLWITMKPYVELAWSNSIPPCQDINDMAPLELSHDFVIESSKKLQYLPKLMGLWALDHMTRNRENVKILYEEGIEDFVTMIRWEFPRFKLRHALNCVCESACNNMILGTLPHPPSLQNICRGNLMKLGSISPQMGINGSISEILDTLQSAI